MNFFEKLFIRMPDFIKGISLTIELTLFCAIFGFLLAIPLVIGVIYGNKFFKNLSKAYITIVRGTPMIVQMFFIYYGLPGIGIKLKPFHAALIGFVLNSAAYQSEYLKGGFLAITTEQLEAAYSIGLNKWEAIRYIIFPQAVRFSIPALTNEIIYLIKYTSVAYLIAVPELFAQAKFFASDTYYYIETFVLIGVLYLLMIFVITKLADWIEKKLYIPGFDISHLK
ncbi:MAG: amino acid ABC transporter permease [Spirochaetes bacterium]|nr:amino acid ABC transporter permease [Spirochaetota bacterium]